MEQATSRQYHKLGLRDTPYPPPPPGETTLPSKIFLEEQPFPYSSPPPLYPLKICPETPTGTETKDSTKTHEL